MGAKTLFKLPKVVFGPEVTTPSQENWLDKWPLLAGVMGLVVGVGLLVCCFVGVLVTFLACLLEC